MMEEEAKKNGFPSPYGDIFLKYGKSRKKKVQYYKRFRPLTGIFF